MDPEVEAEADAVGPGSGPRGAVDSGAAGAEGSNGAVPTSITDSPTSTPRSTASSTAVSIARSWRTRSSTT